jgi:hypothetical protein
VVLVDVQGDHDRAALGVAWDLVPLGLSVAEDAAEVAGDP